MIDLKEQVVKKIRKRIEAPRFKSKIEVARLALDEYEKAESKFYKKRLKEVKKRLEALEISSTRNKDNGNVQDFNDGYDQALIDYGIFTREEIKAHHDAVHAKSEGGKTDGN